MPVQLSFPTPHMSPEQVLELCLLVEMEARWENLRKERSPTPQARRCPTGEDLYQTQKAFSAFRAKLTAYNKRYAPPHATDLVLNYPNRLGPWCRRMRDLFRLVEQDPRVPCPVQLLEKAYRWANGMASRMGKELFRRSEPLDTIQAATRELDALAQWCEGVARSAA